MSSRQQPYEGQIVGSRRNPRVVLLCDEDFLYWIADRLPEGDLAIPELRG